MISIIYLTTLTGWLRTQGEAPDDNFKPAPLSDARASLGSLFQVEVGQRNPFEFDKVGVPFLGRFEVGAILFAMRQWRFSFQCQW